MAELTNIQKEIYNRMGDEESRVIYKARLDYIEHRDVERYTQFLWDENTGMRKKLQKVVETCIKSNRKTAVYGLGHDYKIFIKYMKPMGFTPEILCDGNSALWGECIDGVKVLSKREFLEIAGECMIFISTTKCGETIKRELIESGVNEELIISFTENQYFDVFPCESKEEVFIDSGCYDGDTLAIFNRWCNREYQAIYAFEPNEKTLPACEKIIKTYGMERVNLIQKGTWSREDVLFFDQMKKGLQLARMRMIL